ncbi:MAG: hypothetical protein NW208_11185 [Bryobacter sp.]|nr:hypothetical protein [Bryobacter sp.]
MRRSLLVLAITSAFAWQDALSRLSLTQKDLEGMVQRGLSSGGYLSVPYLPRPAVAAYKALDEAAKVKAVQELLATGKALTTSEAFRKGQDEAIFRSYGGKDYGLKVVSEEQLMKLPPEAMMKAMQSIQYGGIAHEAYRRSAADVRKNLENDLRGAE